MIFNEIYGCYYKAVARIIGLAIDGKLTEKEMNRIVSEEAFNESVLSIIPAIKKQEWQVVDEKMETSIKHRPAMPMTALEKRWLKTILLDPRIALFLVPSKELLEVEPLFYPDDVVYFDRYLDGDNYTDPDYISNFYIVMQAIREQRKVMIQYCNHRNQERYGTFCPVKMEYSDKEDKFRIISAGKWDVRTVNMGRVIRCELLDETFDKSLTLPARNRGTLVFELFDTRNTLERAMMKFAHYKKQAEKIGDDVYRIELEYDKEDETDVVIQIMTFGSAVKVISPDTIQEELASRISKQLSMLDW